jgi:hypothetical protein
MQITYECKGFQNRPRLSDGTHELECSIDDLVWAALTVGRPNIHYVFRDGKSSIYEARFRTSLMRLAVDEHSPSGRFRSTSAARAMDPTEKGMVSYFLGMAVCKLFSARLLGAPWTLHLDVFRDRLPPPFSTLRGSRPDMVAASGTDTWHVFESKGRSAKPTKQVIEAAKKQADTFCDFANVEIGVASIAYFSQRSLAVYLEDPPAKGRVLDALPVGPDDWRYYYSMVLALIADSGSEVPQDEITRPFPQPLVCPIRDLDLTILIDPRVARLLQRKEWSEARAQALLHAKELKEFSLNADGIRIETGASWHKALSLSTDVT